MNLLVMGAKSVIAVTLLVAGGAKCADLPGFAATVRLFAPRAPSHLIRVLAATTAAAELLLGAASLSSPAISWLNIPVFVLACGFIAASAAGYAFFRGRSCSCFGSLSRRRFDAVGIARSVGVAAIAALATLRVRPTLVHVDSAARVLLLAAAFLLALTAFTAARALAVSRAAQPRLAGR